MARDSLLKHLNGPIGYSNCWEDAEIALEALRGSSGRKLITIASAGDVSFSLLCTDPSEIVALDQSPAQIALATLKKTLLDHFELSEIRAFLGTRCHPDRLAFYRGYLRPLLPSPCAAFWDGHRKLLSRGVIHAGRLERYVRFYRTFVLPFLLTPAQRTHVLSLTSLEDQQRFYDQVIYSRTKEWFATVFLDRALVSRFARSRDLFDHAPGDVGTALRRRLTDAITRIPTSDNPFLEYGLRGNFVLRHPHYLREENLERIRGRLDRLHFVPVELTRYLTSSSERYAGFYLSDIFESMDVPAFRESLGRVVAAGDPFARIVYWNMLVRRDSRRVPVPGVTSLTAESERLFRQRRVCFYASLVVEEVAA